MKAEFIKLIYLIGIPLILLITAYSYYRNIWDNIMGLVASGIAGIVSYEAIQYVGFN